MTYGTLERVSNISPFPSATESQFKIAMLPSLFLSCVFSFDTVRVEETRYLIPIIGVDDGSHPSASCVLHSQLHSLMPLSSIGYNDSPEYRPLLATMTNSFSEHPTANQTLKTTVEISTVNNNLDKKLTYPITTRRILTFVQFDHFRRISTTVASVPGEISGGILEKVW